MKHILLATGLLLLYLFPARGQQAANVASVSITVSDLEKSLKFYTEILPFHLEKTYTLQGPEIAQLFGFQEKNISIAIAELSLGKEQISLMNFQGSGHKPGKIPADSRSNDLWFQHIAIVVSDMGKAYQWLREKKVEHVSTAPQTLPDYLPNAAGISAFYFRDPDGHNLEIIHFPNGKGNPKWQPNPKPETLFLGIDHTAIGIDDTDAALAFYRDALGLEIGGNSENYGTEQERLNQVFGAHLLITGLHAAQGFGVEFLDYLAPPGGRAYPANSRPDDLWHWHSTIVVVDTDEVYKQLKAKGYRMVSAKPMTLNEPNLAFHKVFMVRDADGHAVLVVSQ